MRNFQNDVNNNFRNEVNMDSLASVKMLKGKTPMVLVEGKTDYTYYTQIFNPRIVRCCFKDEDRYLIPDNLFGRYNDRVRESFNCDGIENILSDSEINNYDDIIGIQDKDFKTIDLSINSEVIPNNINHRFFVDMHDLEMTIIAYQNSINFEINNVFKIDLHSIENDIIDICLKIAAVRFVNGVVYRTETSVSKKVNNKNKLKEFIYFEPRIDFDYDGFINYIDCDNESRRTDYYDYYNKFKLSKLDKKIFIQGHDFRLILSLYLEWQKYDFSFIKKTLDNILYDKNNSLFEKTYVYMDIREYQEKKFSYLKNPNVFIGD